VSGDVTTLLSLRWTSARLGRRCLLHAPSGAMLGWVGGRPGAWRAVSLLHAGALEGPHATRADACERLVSHVLAALPPGTAPRPRPARPPAGRYALPDW
jgi:hypothetical protein